MKRALLAVCVPFGRVLDGVAMRAARLRGRAWVVFPDVASAGRCVRALDGFEFLGRPLRAAYAKGKSDAIAKLDGTYGTPQHPKLSEAEKRARDAAATDALARRRAKTVDTHRSDLDGAAAASRRAEAEHAAQAAREAEESVPHRRLFVTNLPPATTDAMLSMLFEQFPGFQKAATVPQKPGIAFVDFATEGEAGAARAGLQGFVVQEGHPMRVAFARR